MSELIIMQQSPAAIQLRRGESCGTFNREDDHPLQLWDRIDGVETLVEYDWDAGTFHRVEA